MVKRSRRRNTEEKFAGLTENENCEENLLKYYCDGKGSRRKRHSVIDLILEDQPHLREYARQRTLVGLNMKRRMVKSFHKAGSVALKQLARNSKLFSVLSKAPSGMSNRIKKSESINGRPEEDIPYPDELPAEVVAQDFIRRDARQRGRRAFLLEYCKEHGQRDSVTENALEKGTYLSDEKLLSL